MWQPDKLAHLVPPRAVCTKCPELDSMDNNVTQARSASLLVCLTRTRRSSLCLPVSLSASLSLRPFVLPVMLLDKGV